MTGSGRISVLVSRDLQVLYTVASGLEKEVRSRLRKYTKAVVEPVWKEAVRSNVHTRLQARVLSDTARVAVSDLNVTLKSATVGKVGGIRASVLAGPTEFGAAANQKVTQRSRRGKSYSRRMGRAFGLPEAKGKVVFPAVREVIPRIVSLWMQTTARTVAEEFEKGAS